MKKWVVRVRCLFSNLLQQLKEKRGLKKKKFKRKEKKREEKNGPKTQIMYFSCKHF